MVFVLLMSHRLHVRQMKVKVVLAKPQVKSKFGKGVRGGYSLGFRGDHRVGTSPGLVVKGGSGEMGAVSHDGTCQHAGFFSVSG